jgi:hypothetical protein
VEEIPVEVVREGDDPPPAASSEWRRWIVPACAVVVAASALFVGWTQLQLVRASEREQCIQEAQILAFGPGAASGDREDAFVELLADCGVTAEDG